ncbi:MAG TPA: HAMP domain-containing sensor histidine kinase [Candidatus Baltobacteraceae bacterium]|nr:HAMP domain-containing sensor histidine kinase [Candidatus Baltobacteraceae bacterium]
MKRIALIFALAVILPSLVLAWLAVRSLRDQEFLLERQQSLLDQRATDALAQNVSDFLVQRQQEFAAQVENLAGDGDAREFAAQFDDEIRRHWPLAEVGFCVTLSGKILSPSLDSRPESQMFYLDNKDFLGNREAVEVYRSQNFANAMSGYARNANTLSSLQTFPNSVQNQSSAVQPQKALAPSAAAAPMSSDKMKFGGTAGQLEKDKTELAQPPAAVAGGPLGGTAVNNSLQANATAVPTAADSLALNAPQQNAFEFKQQQQARAVVPQSQFYRLVGNSADQSQNNLSKTIPAEAEFAQLIGGETDGMLARFLQNRLKLMFWHRLNREPDLIFGAQLNLGRVVDGLRGIVQPDPALPSEICLAIVDDRAEPVALSRKNFSANWKRPFVATEIGDALPHWEAAAYLVNPAALTQAARTAELTLGLLIAILVLAIAVGSWLIVSNLNSELKLARQKTDFVSNVSHELKTPLTSIRMFSELLSENRVADSAKQRSYLQIITAEAARLTRLINNVLDFSRLERGEKKYDFQPCDLTEIVRATAGTFRPHLEAGGFKFHCELPETKIAVRGDSDALAQIIVNLLSNAEKYSNGGKEIGLQVAQKESPLPYAEVKVLDRGPGVPPGSEEKIFEKFYRAHDSLGSGIQGSGLGLTLARQIARAHGGDVIYEPRADGGSSFVLRLPISGGTA